MKYGICCKCKATDIYYIEVSKSEYGIPISNLSKAGLRYYICTNCGYVETFVPNKQTLKKISLMGKYISPKIKKNWTDI
ncbi:MAG: hypothetical protein ABF289_19260 [Clostridiales bacterium]